MTVDAELRREPMSRPKQRPRAVSDAVAADEDLPESDDDEGLGEEREEDEMDATTGGGRFSGSFVELGVLGKGAAGEVVSARHGFA